MGACTGSLCVSGVTFSNRVFPLAAGYDSHYTNKMGKVREGSATFWRSTRFRKIAGRDIRLRDIFVNGHSLFQPLLSASPELELALQKVTTIAQATLLAPMPGASADGEIQLRASGTFLRHTHGVYIQGPGLGLGQAWRCLGFRSRFGVERE